MEEERQVIYETKKILKDKTIAKFELCYMGRRYFQIDAFVENKNVGFCNFFIEKTGSCFINLIEITNKQYENKGIASKMLNLTERFAKSQNCFIVEGKFIPKSNSAEHFYQKNGYKIEWDYDMYRYGICKSLIFKDNNEDVPTF